MTTLDAFRSDENRRLLQASQEIMASSEKLARYNQMLRNEARRTRDHAKQAYSSTARIFDRPLDGQ